MKTCEVTALKRIPLDEVSFHPHSFADQRMRLFSWKGQLYRAIGKDYAPFFTQLFKRNAFQSLIEKSLLIDSQVTPFTLEGYEMVVRHRRILFTSYPNEWCAAMLKDAALSILDLALELGRSDLTLADAHPWNLLYDIDSGKFVFVDLGSITSITDFTWPVYGEFCRFCFYPLLLMSQGQEQIARLLMCEKNGVRESDLSSLTGFSSLSLSSRYRSLIRRMESSIARRVPGPRRKWLKRNLGAVRELLVTRTWNGGSGNPPERVRQRFHRHFLEKIRLDVERIDLSAGSKRAQPDPNRGEVSISPRPTWSATQRSVHRLLTELQPQTVLDVSSDEWYSEVASLLGSRVVRWDTDPARVTRLYNDSRASRSPILALIMDFAQPTPPRGLADCWSISAMERFKCDMVLALGSLPRIVCEGRLNFEQIVEGLAVLSKRWVVVEFVPAEEAEDLKRLQSPKVSWYTLNGFLIAVRKRFGRVEIIPSVDNTRRLMLCEKPR